MPSCWSRLTALRTQTAEPWRLQAFRLAMFPAVRSIRRSRGGAIVTRCPACNRRADKCRRGRTEKYREVQGEKYELQNMDAHHRSEFVRRVGDSGSAGGAGSNSTATRSEEHTSELQSR